MKLAESLGLPAGWRAFRYQSHIEIENPEGLKGTIPAPYENQYPEYWKRAAAKVVKEIENKNERRHIQGQ